MSVSGISVFQAKAHLWRYWNWDGLPNIITGFAMILQGLAYFWLGHHSRSLLPGVLLLSSAMILLDQITLRKIARMAQDAYHVSTYRICGAASAHIAYRSGTSLCQ